VTLVTGEQNLDAMAERSEVGEQLALVGLAARGGLGVEPAVG
jgi:hypothetical protein